MNAKLTKEEKLEAVLNLIRAAYSEDFNEYKIIGRKLIVPDDSKTYVRIFDIPSVLAGMNKKRSMYSGFYFPKGRISFKNYEEVCLAYLEEYNTEKVRKNYAAEKKKKDLENRDFGDYKPGGIYYTSWGYDETHIDFYICNKIIGQTIYLQKLGKTIQDLPDCMVQYRKCRPDVRHRLGEEFTKKLVFVNNHYEQNWQVTVCHDILFTTDPEKWHHETSPYGRR